jgi:diguanylate cyclase (GGDEF)-like protein
MLQEIAVTARTTLSADRATCYACDVRGSTVAAVYTTEDDPARRAVLARAIGRGATELPVWRLQMDAVDPLLVVEDISRDGRVPPALAGRLGAGAFVGARLEHASVVDGGAPALLGALYITFARPRRFDDEDRRRARGLRDLASLALANAHLQAQTLAGLEEHRRLAAEQAALRRVATDVAADAPPERVFGRVAEEAAALLGVEAAVVTRFGEDGAAVVGTHGGHSELGELLPLTGSGALATVARTGRAHEIRDYSALEPGSPLRAHALANGFRASVAAPVSAGGSLWGAVLATTRRPSGIPDGATARLGHFAHLVALAIANAEARADLVAQAASDPLTGLANNRAFTERLRADSERARRHDRPLSLIIFDLDHFKRVNDRHGHLVGDGVLVELSHRLRPLVRAEDTLARVGGEEFAWLLPETEVEDALQAAERARLRVAGAPYPPVGSLTVSAGVAQLAPAMATTDLYRAADTALYVAKSRGRNVCVTYAGDLRPG